MITLEVPVERTTTEQHGINEQVLVFCLSVDRSFNRRELKRPMQSLISHSEAARNIVTNLLEAINREDFTTARTFLQNDMRYIGVLGSRDGADASLAEVQQRSLKFGIREVIAEGNEVAVFYDLSTSGVILFAAGRFQIRDGKVILIHVVFDPRPVLETMAKK
jgi:hypothetical protein